MSPVSLAASRSAERLAANDRLLLRDLRFQIPHDEIDREEVLNLVEAWILAEVGEVRVRHAGLELDEPVRVHLSVDDELGVARKDRLGEEFLARDLQVELAFEAKD